MKGLVVGKIAINQGQKYFKKKIIYESNINYSKNYNTNILHLK